MSRRIILIGITILMAFCCVRVIGLERRKSDLKRDRIEMSHIKYGLFNVDEWKKVIADIITKKIKELKITKENRPAMKRQVEDILRRVLTEVESVIRKENRSRGFMGWVRGGAMDLFDVMGDVRKGIPQYADMLLDYIEDPRNKQALQENLIKRFNEMADRTVGTMDYTLYNAILEKYAAEDKATCLSVIDQELAQVRSTSLVYIVLLVLCCGGLVVLILATGQAAVTELATMVFAALVLLLTGLSLPMIDIEATISSFSFTLVGEPVEFKDQVLFFQSKSILQVVGILLKSGGPGLVLVAFLVFTFSVLIPMAKLVASLITIVRNEPPAHWFHRFLVFKSGKWSMADVMVVAIFMSYIGFNGVINSQLTELAAFSGNVEIFTTNNSVLQSGFYLFTGYCVIGLLLSAVIEKRLSKG